MRTKLGRFLLHTTASLGLVSVSFLNAYAGEPPIIHHGHQPNCPYPIVPAPGVPSTVTPLPATPSTPGAPTTPSMPATPGAPAATPEAVDPGAAAALPADAGATAAPDGGESGLTSGTGTDMIGRSDFFNRFNLFDTQSAIPRNRVWFNFQRNQGFNTGTAPVFTGQTPGIPVQTAVANRPTTYLYRMGAEFAMSERASVAVQHQYIGVSDTTTYDPSWGDPQFMAKYAVMYDCDRVVSATLGFSPHFSISPDEVRSPRPRLYPGLLFWQQLSDRAFAQGGTQVGIPLANGDIPTFDYALSTGYWVYRAPECESCSRSILTGIAPQIELFGQHAFWDNTFDGNNLVGGTFASQPRHVLDVTLGTSVMLRNLVLGAGYSFPVTGAEARRGEIIGSVIYRF